VNFIIIFAPAICQGILSLLRSTRPSKAVKTWMINRFIAKLYRFAQQLGSPYFIENRGIFSTRRGHDGTVLPQSSSALQKLALIGIRPIPAKILLSKSNWPCIRTGLPCVSKGNEWRTQCALFLLPPLCYLPLAPENHRLMIPA
jgi:hypothetical protein